MTTSAGTGVPGFNRNVRDEAYSREAAKIPPKSQQELLADAYLSAHDAEKARWKADDQARIKAQRDRKLKEQAQVDRKRKQATFEWKESMIDAVYDQHNLSAIERGRANEMLGEDVHNTEKAVIAALQVVANRRSQ
jgi:hypothetical protein